MKDRGNTLPAWLQKRRLPHRDDRQVAERLRRQGRARRGAQGLRHLARAARRLGLRLLQLRHEQQRQAQDLGRQGLRPQARRVRRDRGDVSARTPGVGRRVRQSSQKVFGPGALHLLGHGGGEGLLARRHRQDDRGSRPAERKSKKPFFIWWSPAAPHREDVADDADGPPGPRSPAARALRRQDVEATSCRSRRTSTSPTSPTSPRPSRTTRPLHDRRADRASSSSTTRAAIGSLLAVDDHVKKLVKTLKRTNQLKNTLIVFLSDNGWMQGEHRIAGDKFLPYEESLRVPFILRGPGIPAGRTVHGQVANVDFAPTLLDAANARAGRTMDGVSLLPVARRPSTAPRPRDRARGARRRCSAGDFGRFNAWDRPYTGRAHRPLHLRRVHGDGRGELYDRKTRSVPAGERGRRSRPTPTSVAD